MTPTAVSSADPVALPQRALPPLTRLDDYEIEAVLAQSALAVVYRGFDHALQRPVAIKEYLPDAIAQRGAAARVLLRSRGSSERFEIGRSAFIAEAQTLARCEHPALLRVQRLLRANGTVYRVMPLLAGVGLLEHCAAPGAAPEPAQLRAWLDTLLGALAALHDAGFVHGAVSPDNILLQSDGAPLLLDFDAVRRALLDDGTRSLLEPPTFEPIEQHAGGAPRRLGPWTDLYGLAASLLACANAGSPASVDGDASFIAHWQHHHGAALMPAEVARMFGALDACLAEQPAQRPGNVAELRLLIEHGVQARPAPSATPMSAEEAAADGARVIADLDQTFAAIAAHAHAAAPKAAGADEPLFAMPHHAGLPPLSASASVALPVAAPSWSLPGPGPGPGPGPVPVPMPMPMPMPMARRIAAAAALLVLAGAAAWWWARAPSPAGEADASSATAPVAVAAALEAVPPTPAAEAPLQLPVPSAGPADDAAAAGTPPITPPSAGAPVVAAKPPADSPVKPPAKAKPPPARHKAAPTQVAAASPSEVCGARTQFALYRCMHTQCAKAQWHGHAQCERLRRADAVN